MSVHMRKAMLALGILLIPVGLVGFFIVIFEFLRARKLSNALQTVLPNFIVYYYDKEMGQKYKAATQIVSEIMQEYQPLVTAHGKDVVKQMVRASFRSGLPLETLVAQAKQAAPGKSESSAQEQPEIQQPSHREFWQQYERVIRLDCYNEQTELMQSVLLAADMQQVEILKPHPQWPVACTCIDKLSCNNETDAHSVDWSWTDLHGDQFTCRMSLQDPHADMMYADWRISSSTGEWQGKAIGGLVSLAAAQSSSAPYRHTGIGHIPHAFHANHLALLSDQTQWSEAMLVNTSWLGDNERLPPLIRTGEALSCRFASSVIDDASTVIWCEQTAVIAGKPLTHVHGYLASELKNLMQNRDCFLSQDHCFDEHDLEFADFELLASSWSYYSDYRDVESYRIVLEDGKIGELKVHEKYFEMNFKVYSADDCQDVILEVETSGGNGHIDGTYCGNVTVWVVVSVKDIMSQARFDFISEEEDYYHPRELAIDCCDVFLPQPLAYQHPDTELPVPDTILYDETRRAHWHQRFFDLCSSSYWFDIEDDRVCWIRPNGHTHRLQCTDTGIQLLGWPQGVEEVDRMRCWLADWLA